VGWRRLESEKYLSQEEEPPPSLKKANEKRKGGKCFGFKVMNAASRS
jgi:hypothetical protein